MLLSFVVLVLEKWWDVDEVEDLDRLRALIAAEGSMRAPASAAALEKAGELRISQNR